MDKVKEVNMTDVKDLKPIKSEGIDIKQFDGEKVEIEGIEQLRMPSEFAECGYQWVARVFSRPLVNFKKDDGEEVKIRASELFNLSQDKEGKLTGFPVNEKAKLYRLMKKVGVEHPAELLGKKVLVTTYENKGKTFLRFVY